MSALLMLALLLAPPTAPGKKKQKPVTRVDRTRAVGAPVIDEKSRAGFYLWLEDGWFNVAAVNTGSEKRKLRKRRMSLRVSSTKKIKRTSGDFGARAGRGSAVFSAFVGEVVVKGKFKTEGNVTFRSELPLYVGPLARKAARTITIGRY